MDAAERPIPAAAPDLPEDLVFVDLETTGGNPDHHRITEIGIVRMTRGEVLEQWSTLVNPEVAIPPYIQSFTGITDAMVADAPRFRDVAHEVLERLHGAVFVAHNARFDYSFLRAELRRIERPFRAPVLCTVKLSRRLFPQHPRHNLDAVMERFGLACAERHRALGDARVLKDFWLALRRTVPQEALAAAAAAVLAAVRLPAQLPPELADELPEGPGVYRLFGEDEALLYVGTGASLRARVLAQLAGEGGAAREGTLARRTRRVEWTQTAGELGARLLESQWVKRHEPPHNRRPKGRADGYTLCPGAPGAAGRAVEIVCLADLDPARLADCRGVFHTEKDARKALCDIARAQQLCLKVVGIEPGEGSCVAHQTGRCRGACIGLEPPARHALRLAMALLPLKLKDWPFPGRIALRERAAGWGGDAQIGAELHVLDHWSYLGTARSDEELAALRTLEAPAVFDAGVYRILTRWFEAHPHIDWHDLGAGTGAA